MKISEPRADAAITARIMGCVAKLGGQTQAAQTVGVSQPGLRKWVTGEARIPFEAVIALAKAAKVSIEWLATGEGPVDHTPTTIMLPFYMPDAEGKPVAQPAGASNLIVPREFLERYQLDPTRTGLVEVTGDAMAPDIPGGSVAIIDMRYTMFGDESVYVFGRPNAIVMVRRVTFEGAVARLSGSGPGVRDVMMSPEDQVAGKMVIWGRVVLTLKRA